MFNSIDIMDLMTTVWPRPKNHSSLAYAIRCVNDGLGLQLQVIWSPTLCRVDDTSLAKLKVKDLGRVRFVIDEKEDEESREDKESRAE